MRTSALDPYLFFSGRADEAIRFYRDRLGATVEIVLRFNESPDPMPEGMLQAGFEAKVMHATIRIAGSRMLISDGCDDKAKFSGFSLALALPTEADCHAKFEALADGGQVTMPLSKTYWSACYGMVTDRFGVQWMVMLYDPANG